jgi:hypothetical protein
MEMSTSAYSSTNIGRNWTKKANDIGMELLDKPTTTKAKYTAKVELPRETQ